MAEHPTPETAPDLAAYLLARYAEEEASARAALAEAETMHPPLTWRWAVIDSWTSTRMPPGAPSPDRIFAEVAAKRAIIDLHGGRPMWNEGGDLRADTLHVCEDALEDADGCRTLRALAQPYAGRPDFRDEWKSGA